MERSFSESNGGPAWDDVQAEKLIGATVVVGLTRNEATGQRLEQFHGTVMHASPKAGITLRLEGIRSGELYTLPPDLSAFFPARPGSYRLRETGEVVDDPDYTATWTISPPSN